MIDGSCDVSRRTATNYIRPEELPPAWDYHVRYFRSKLRGQRVYGYVHSAIEHVFVRDDFRY